MPNHEKKKGLVEIFLEVAKPNQDGVSRKVSIDELEQYDPRFRTTNGCSWARDDGSLGAKYLIKREKGKGRVIAVQLTGLKEDPIAKGIRKDIVETIRKQRCAILDLSSDIQVDHKNGRYNTIRMTDSDKQRLDDFQPLCRCANTAKRGHCKKCSISGKRFDATRLGYSIGWLNGGDEEYDQWQCKGCYWHDPKRFNEEVSKDYQFKP